MILAHFFFKYFVCTTSFFNFFLIYFFPEIEVLSNWLQYLQIQIVIKTKSLQ